MKILARAIATLRKRATDRLHNRYCPCGCGFPEDGDTVATKIVPDSYDRNREASTHVCETSRCWSECNGAR